MAPTAVQTPAVDLTAAALAKKEAAAANGKPALAPLDASKLTYTYTTNPRAVPDEAVANAGAESVVTDHMVIANWTATEGWAVPELKPYGPLSLMPTASCLHYATECFEGLKVYRGYDGKLRIFRPDRNAARLRMSSERISLPTFDPAEVEKLIIALLSVDGAKWLPKEKPGHFLYIRPTVIGTAPQLGVGPSRAAMLYVIVTYMPRMDAPPGGMRLLTSPEDMVRAWVGGFGYAKVGANYGPSLLATGEAKARGYHQILWLYGPQGECTEAGASNLFVVWKRKDGKKELITAPLDDKLILDGVTRRSVLELVRERLSDDVEITERKYTIDEVLEADSEGRIIESFASGTAYFICPISQIHHRGRDVNIPMGAEGAPGEVTSKVKGWLGDIMYGRTQHEWGVVIPEKQ